MSAEPAVSGLPDLPIVQHAGERVLTTELLAKVYGVEPKTLHDNYQDNKRRFVDGVHLIRLSGEDLKTFKRHPETSGVADKFSSHLILWTERGAARHAKLISTDEAWTVFGRLEDIYFDDHGAPAFAAPPPGRLDLAREATETFALWHEFVATTIGFDRNQAMIAANRAARRAVGIDVLEEIGLTALPAPHAQTEMTVGELGTRMGGIKARAMNLLLTQHGLSDLHPELQGRFGIRADRPRPAPQSDDGRRHEEPRQVSAAARLAAQRGRPAADGHRRTPRLTAARAPPAFNPSRTVTSLTWSAIDVPRP